MSNRLQALGASSVVDVSAVIGAPRAEAASPNRGMTPNEDVRLRREPGM